MSTTLIFKMVSSLHFETHFENAPRKRRGNYMTDAGAIAPACVVCVQ